jgi:hypothetical protein
MVARVNGGVASGQVLVGSLSHFTVTIAGNASAKLGVDSTIQKILEMVATKSTVVILGAVGSGGFRFAVEGDTAWTAAALQVSLRALGTVDSIDLSSDSVADYAY